MNMTPAGTTQFIGDPAGHILAEADATGATQREYIRLDDLPLAVVANVPTTPTLWYVLADHLGRPIRMTDATKAIVWSAEWLPFGGVQSITGSASLDLRFPGQWFQIEAGLAYNWHRRYDSTAGRYVEPAQRAARRSRDYSSTTREYVRPTQPIDARRLEPGMGDGW